MDHSRISRISAALNLSAMLPLGKSGRLLFSLPTADTVFLNESSFGFFRTLRIQSFWFTSALYGKTVSATLWIPAKTPSTDSATAVTTPSSSVEFRLSSILVLKVFNDSPLSMPLTLANLSEGLVTAFCVQISSRFCRKTIHWWTLPSLNRQTEILYVADDAAVPALILSWNEMRSVACSSSGFSSTNGRIAVRYCDFLGMASIPRFPNDPSLNRFNRRISVVWIFLVKSARKVGLVNVVCTMLLITHKCSQTRCGINL